MVSHTGNPAQGGGFRSNDSCWTHGGAVLGTEVPQLHHSQHPCKPELNEGRGSEEGLGDAEIPVSLPPPLHLLLPGTT